MVTKRRTQARTNPLMCTYPYTYCHTRRAKKENGELHKLCEFHRTKANTNQRKFIQRKQARSDVKCKLESGPKYSGKKKQSNSLQSPISAFDVDALLLENFSSHDNHEEQMYEPYPYPVRPTFEDLYCLYLTVLDSPGEPRSSEVTL